jgi:uncharacterized protein (DUF1499 family)
MFRILALLLVIFIMGFGFTMYRFISATHDPQIWHVDPQIVERPLTPNTYLVAPQTLHLVTVDREAPQYSVTIDVLAKAFDDFIVRQNNIGIVAGSVDEGWITYVQRSAVLRVPDYITIKFIPLEGDASTVIIWSRSRFGHGDMGVNKARIDSWLSNFESLERTPVDIVLLGATPEVSPEATPEAASQ